MSDKSGARIQQYFLKSRVEPFSLFLWAFFFYLCQTSQRCTVTNNKNVHSFPPWTPMLKNVAFYLNAVLNKKMGVFLQCFFFFFNLIFVCHAVFTHFGVVLVAVLHDTHLNSHYHCRWGYPPLDDCDENEWCQLRGWRLVGGVQGNHNLCWSKPRKWSSSSHTLDNQNKQKRQYPHFCLASQFGSAPSTLRVRFYFFFFSPSDCRKYQC